MNRISWCVGWLQWWNSTQEPRINDHEARIAKLETAVIAKLAAIGAQLGGEADKLQADTDSVSRTTGAKT